MARRYDSRTTIFSPEGRLYQVEYAMEAIGNAGTCLGIVCPTSANGEGGGIVLAAERKNTNKLLDEELNAEKIYCLNENMACSVAGITSDANLLIDELRKISERHRYTYGKVMPCEQVVAHLCDIKQAYTQYGGKRPFGVSLLYMGWDEELGYQLYQSDPSGNYSGWRATCIGNNSSAAMSLLEQEYDEDSSSKPEEEERWVANPTIDSTLDLAIKVLVKTLDTTKLTSDKVELATLQRQQGRTHIKILDANEKDRLIKKYEELAKKLEDAKKERERQAQALGSRR